MEFCVSYSLNVREPLKLCNCTVTADFNQRICIEKLSDLKPKKFDAVTVKAGLSTFLVFRSGKIVCVGAKNPQVAREDFKCLDEKLIQLGVINSPCTNLCVVNLVSHFAVQPLNIANTYKYFQNLYLCIYEPELFPALKMNIKGVTVLMYWSGKIILTGAKTIKDLEQTYTSISSILDQHSKIFFANNMSDVISKSNTERKKTAKQTSTGQKNKRSVDTMGSTSKAEQAKATEKWSVNDWVEYIKEDITREADEQWEKAEMNSISTVMDYDIL